MAGSLGRTAGILGTLGSPLFGHTLRALVTQGAPVGVALLDAKDFGAKDLAIWEENTADRLPLVDLAEFASLQIPFYFLTFHNSPETAVLVSSLGLDVLINGGPPRILKADFRRTTSGGTQELGAGRYHYQIG